MCSAVQNEPSYTISINFKQQYDLYRIHEFYSQITCQLRHHKARTLVFYRVGFQEIGRAVTSDFTSELCEKQTIGHYAVGKRRKQLTSVSSSKVNKTEKIDLKTPQKIDWYQCEYQIMQYTCHWERSWYQPVNLTARKTLTFKRFLPIKMTLGYRRIMVPVKTRNIKSTRKIIGW